MSVRQAVRAPRPGDVGGVRKPWATAQQTVTESLRQRLTKPRGACQQPWPCSQAGMTGMQGRRPHLRRPCRGRLAPMTHALASAQARAAACCTSSVAHPTRCARPRSSSLQRHSTRGTAVAACAAGNQLSLSWGVRLAALGSISRFVSVLPPVVGRRRRRGHRRVGRQPQRLLMGLLARRQRGRQQGARGDR